MAAHKDAEIDAHILAALGPDEIPLASRPVDTVPGHWLLARLGKRVLRPGGLRLTKLLLRRAQISGKHVVEFAPGMGRSALLVLDHAPADYVGVDSDPLAAAWIDKLVSVRGRAIAAEAAASGLPDCSADVVLAEGVLTIQSEQGKADIIAEGFRLLKPGGRYLLHELAVKDDTASDEDRATIRAALAQAMHVSARPKTIADWRTMLEDQGFVVDEVITSPLALLEPHRVISDEGLIRALKFARNVLRDKKTRERVFMMAKTMRAHKKILHAVGLVASKPEVAGL
ncbi:MAG: methyltransferase domain-containing protein [Nakamurella sp.]